MNDRVRGISPNLLGATLIAAALAGCDRSPSTTAAPVAAPPPPGLPLRSEAPAGQGRLDLPTQPAAHAANAVQAAPTVVAAPAALEPTPVPLPRPPDPSTGAAAPIRPADRTAAATRGGGDGYSLARQLAHHASAGEGRPTLALRAPGRETYLGADDADGDVRARRPSNGPLAARIVPQPPPYVPAHATALPAGFGPAGGFGARANANRAPETTPEVPALPTLDPNGRFATTYRPGGGHLAWFDAAVTRGEIPAGARDFVGDFGARYAPDMAAPTDHALAFRVDQERGALPPHGGPTHLRIALRSTATAATDRPPMSVNVVLDVSNSMEGASITYARQAAQALVERLLPTDHFSLVTFGGDAQLMVPEGLVGPRRAEILRTIAGVGLQGGTNISAGLEIGYQQAHRGPTGTDWVHLVMLLSDGRPNAGETRREALGGQAAAAFQDGIQTSAFGLGQDYDGALMSGIADQGAGGYYYLRDGAGIAAALATELESRLQPVAQAVEVRVRLRPDVRLTQTYGSRRLGEGEAAAVRAQELAVDTQVARRDHIARDRQIDQEGGMRFFIPGFSRDDRHVILLGLDVPGGLGERQLATVELRYKDRLSHRNVVEEIPVRTRFADSDAASAATLDPSMQRTVQGFDAGEAMVAAAHRIDAGDTAGASAALAERAQLMRRAAETLHEPRLAEDAGRLDRFRNLVGGAGELSQPLVLAMLLNTTGQGMLH